MGAYESHLNLPQYGYDMVVATTEQAINATVKQYLLNYEGREFVSCYKLAPEGSDESYVPMPYEEVLAIAGMNPFTIPETELQNDKQKEAVARLYDKEFAFAFRADMGIPLGFPVKDIPKVIVFHKAGTEVAYNLFFKNISVLNIEDSGRRGFRWQNLAQAYSEKAKDPWVFKFRVNLDLSSGSTSLFDSLLPAIQQKVKNLNPDSAFSVQQLYLDLNTALLTSDPTITGLDKSSWAYLYLTVGFIQNYYKTLKEEAKNKDNPNGNFLLGYTIKPTKPNNSSPSIIPTDLNIMISPFVDERGMATEEYNMFTLNYLVMSKDHTMPPSIPFIWNWIDDGQSSGAMAIKREVFSSFLRQTLSPSLQQLCLIPVVYVHANSVSTKWNCTYQPNPDPVYYELIEEAGPRVLSIKYTATAHEKSAWLYNINEIESTVTIDSNIYLENNQIRSVTVANVYIWIKIWGGVTHGNLVTYSNETAYEIGVDAFGSLSAKMAPGSPKFTDLSQGIDPNGWSQFVTGWQVDDLISDIKKRWVFMKDFLDGHDKSIETMLNNSGVWVFPGGKTFAFKEAKFSNFQDLTTLVTYVEPEDADLLRIKS